MNDIQAIFENRPVRIVGTNENPLFVLRDVCDILELQPAAVARRLDKGVISNHPLETPGGIQTVNVVNESGLYNVIFDSRKPQAKKFQSWVTGEVLPSIRKTGSYQIQPKTPLELIQMTAAEMMKTNERIDNIEYQVSEQMTLDYAQQCAIENAKKRRVEKLWSDEIEGRSELYDTKRKLYARFGRDLKNSFAAASYRDIRRKDFEEAMNYIKGWRPSLV